MGTSDDYFVATGDFGREGAEPGFWTEPVGDNNGSRLFIGGHASADCDTSALLCYKRKRERRGKKTRPRPFHASGASVPAAGRPPTAQAEGGTAAAAR